jgi:hypothetical protein
MTKSRIAFVLWLVVWLGMLFVGFGFYRSVVNQHVLGYPSSGQFDLCIVYPGFWAALNAILIALSRKTPLLVKRWESSFRCLQHSHSFSLRLEGV